MQVDDHLLTSNQADSTSSGSQRILLIHRFFWPDSPPYASLLREIGEYLAASDHHITVLGTQPSYKVEIENESRPYRESLGKLDVRRVRLFRERSRATWLRGINSVLFCWKILWHLLIHGGKYDVVMCSTVPPVITGAATSLGCRLRGCRFLYHAMDIWPEVANLTGQMRKGILYRITRAIDTWTCCSATAVICLSDDMRRTFLARSAKLESTVQVIGNFELPAYETETESPQIKTLRKPANKFRVLFAGNMGRYQALDSVVRAATLVTNPVIEFALMGTGAMKETLIRQAEQAGCLGDRIVFLPHQSVDVAKSLMLDADVSLVTLAKGVSTVAYPSKTLTLLAMGCPLGVMMESDSELSQMVQQHQLGFAVDCDDAEGMAAAISRLADSPAEVEAIRVRVREYAKEHAVSAAILPKWAQLIEKVIAK